MSQCSGFLMLYVISKVGLPRHSHLVLQLLSLLDFLCNLGAHFSSTLSCSSGSFLFRDEVDLRHSIIETAMHLYLVSESTL